MRDGTGLDAFYLGSAGTIPKLSLLDTATKGTRVLCQNKTMPPPHKGKHARRDGTCLPRPRTRNLLFPLEGQSSGCGADRDGSEEDLWLATHNNLGLITTWTANNRNHARKKNRNLTARSLPPYAKLQRSTARHGYHHEG